MITLQTTGDYLTVFVLAAVAGLIGGLAAELLLNRNGETGTFELPGRRGGFFDLGGFSSLVVGAVVGVAILIVFPPETTIVNNAAGAAATTFRSYDILRLVATSLVAGSAGGSVLTALQARVTAAVNESRVQFAITTGQQQLDQLAETAKEQVSQAIRSASGPQAGVRSRGALSESPGPGVEGGTGAAPGETITALAAALDRRAQQGREALAAIARRPD